MTRKTLAEIFEQLQDKLTILEKLSIAKTIENTEKQAKYEVIQHIENSLLIKPIPTLPVREVYYIHATDWNKYKQKYYKK